MALNYRFQNLMVVQALRSALYEWTTVFDFYFVQVAILLDNIMADNPVLPRLYQTGVFYFILMYTGRALLMLVYFLPPGRLRSISATSAILASMLYQL